jgi:uroporphyrin-III C-methyltransferase/precorrin-2 dehydrogenase/sirohydrochlorin ferrochelatase
VFLVGAGPGRADLLTLRALHVLGQADVILHDSLVSEGVLDLARRDADRIDVGKRAGGRQHSQEDIHRLMLEEARKGRQVVRLKGGDPFIFGRGGEELEFLHAHGIGFEVVPGITAATGCGAYAGIPLTHRDHARIVSFVTGHPGENSQEAAGDTRVGTDWAGIAGQGKTVVVYMGVRKAAVIRQELLQAGICAGLPVALVANGTQDTQRVFHGSVDSLTQLAAQAGTNEPGLLVIGQVASLGVNLAWFNTSGSLGDALVKSAA